MQAIVYGLVVFYGISIIVDYLIPNSLVQSARLVEYTDCFSAEG